MYLAKNPGVLPKTPRPTIEGISLPPGRTVTPSEDYAGGDPATSPALWITNDHVGNVGALWKALAAKFQSTGLWPLVLESLEGDDDRPWLCGELDPTSSSRPESYDPKDVLSEWWTNVVPQEEEEKESLKALEPFDRTFPGLAPAAPASPVDVTAPGAVALNLEGRLGLVSVSRPADALAVLGWMGPMNHFEDMGLLSAILRSWEHRFGAFLVGVGFSTLSLGVQRPPSTSQLATAIAAEHFAACSDNIYQGSGSIKAYSKELVGQPAWTFWWD